jgi:quercetin dioxygenase-like cupin family protein
MDLIHLKDMTAREIVPGFKARFIHSPNMTFSYWDVTAGSSLPAHSHPHEQVANMLEGRFEFTVDGAAQVLEPGDVLVIPSHVPHSGKALTDCRILDVFYPVREEYR